MKSYSDYMNAITGKQLYKGLLSYGLFTEKLPPVFSSESFYDYCESLTASFSKKDEHDYIPLDSIRNTNIPRQLGIPNPMAYQLLCKSLEENWGELKKYFKKNTESDSYKVSQIHIRKRKKTKALFTMNYDNWKQDGNPSDNLMVGAKYVVHADISTCFPSIYTHSLCWALVGKDVAKGNRKDELWYNEIDRKCQKLRNGETHGLMIGPHASNVLSEIILTSIDFELQKERKWKYVRHIDDYTCFVKDEAAGQQFLNSLDSKLRFFDLPLNHKKTSIQKMPTALTEQWNRKLNGFSLLESYGKVSYKKVKAFFDFAIELMNEATDGATVLNYAIKVVSGQKALTESAKEYFVKESMHLAVLYPYLLSIIDEHVLEGATVNDKNLIQEFINRVYEEGKIRGNYEGMVYAIFFAIKYNYLVDGLDINEVVCTDSCLLKLFSWLYCQKNKDKGGMKVLKEEAKRLEADNMDRNWLFIYEVLPKSSLHKEWVPMKDAGVSFLRPEYRY